MRNFVCIACGKRCYSASSLHNLVNSVCPTCGGILTELRNNNVIEPIDYFSLDGVYCIVLARTKNFALILRPQMTSDKFAVFVLHEPDPTKCHQKLYFDDLEKAWGFYQNACSS